MTENNENNKDSFFNRLFGKKDDGTTPEPENTEGTPEMPDALKALFSMLGDPSMKPASDDEMPPEIRALVEGLRAAGTNVEAINIGGDCDCPPGHPQCGKTTVETLIDWVKNFSVRVLHDPEDEGNEEKMDYFAEEDVRLALFAAARLGELSALAGGVPVKEVAFARAVAGSIIGNAGEILNATELQVDLGKTEVPDTIPSDWKMDE